MALVENLIGAGVPAQLADLLVPDITTTETAFPLFYNGSQVYSKAFSGVTGPNAGNATTAHGISNLSKVILLAAAGEYSGPWWYSCPNGHNSSSGSAINIQLDATNWKMASANDLSSGTYNGFVLYTKSSGGTDDLREKAMGLGASAGLAKTLIPDIDTTEQETPWKRNGKQVYSKAFNSITGLNANTVNTAHGFPSGFEILWICGSADNGTNHYAVPNGKDDSNAAQINVTCDTTNIDLSSPHDWTGYTIQLVALYTID